MTRKRVRSAQRALNPLKKECRTFVGYIPLYGRPQWQTTDDGRMMTVYSSERVAKLYHGKNYAMVTITGIWSRPKRRPR